MKVFIAQSCPSTIPFFRGSSRLKDQSQVLHCRQILYCLSQQGSHEALYRTAEGKRRKNLPINRSVKYISSI